MAVSGDSGTPEPPDSRRISLGEDNGGARLDRFLAQQLEASRADVRRLLASGAVSLDGRACTYRDKGLLLPGSGEVVVRGFRRREEQRAADADAGPTGTLRTLAEGPGWIAVDKPAGWPVHPLEEGETGTCLNALAAAHPEVHGVGEEGGLRSGIVHRLDIDTSGVLLFALTGSQWRRLREAFSEHRVRKTYRAIVVGDARHVAHALFCAAPGEVGFGSWGAQLSFDLAVARHKPAFVRVLDGSWTTQKRGHRVSQCARVIEDLGEYSLVEVRIITGFLHQIRVTLGHLGFPVVGDALYGDARALVADAGRQMLHAASLGFEEISASSPDPPDFQATLRRLRDAAG